METIKNYTRTEPHVIIFRRWLLALLLQIVAVSMALGEGPEDLSFLLPPQVEVVEIQDMVCPNVDNGFLHLAVTGGVPPYSIFWDFDGAGNPFPSFNPPENDTLMFFFIGAGTLTITIVDAEGDETTFEYNFFDVPESPEVIIHQSVVGCNSGAVELDYDTNLVEILGGGLTDINGPVADWDEMDNLPPGEYFLFLDYDVMAPPGFPAQSTEVNCQIEMPIDIFEEEIDISVTGPDDICLGSLCSEPLVLEVELEGGTAPYTLFIETILGDSVITFVEDSVDNGIATIELFFDPGSLPYDCPLDDLFSVDDLLVNVEVMDDNGCEGIPETLEFPVEIIHLDVVSIEPICIRTDNFVCMTVNITGGQAPYNLMGTISMCGEEVEVNETGLLEGENDICTPLPPLPDVCLPGHCSPCPCPSSQPCQPGNECIFPCGDLSVSDDSNCQGQSVEVEIPFSDTIGVSAEVSHPTDSTQNDSTITTELTGLDSLTNVCLEKLDTASGDWIKVDSIIGMEPDSFRQGVAIFEGLQPGTYRVVADDGGVCGTGTSEEIEIEEPPLPIEIALEGIAPTDSSQSDGQIKIMVTDGANDTFYVVVTTHLDTFTLPGATFDTVFAGIVVADSMGCIFILDLFPLVDPAWYGVTVSDPSGEKAPGSGSVEVPPWECEMEITFGSSVVPIACAGDSTLVTAIVLIGDPPYVYSFSTGDVQGPTSNSNAITPVPAGTHSVTITDVQPCERVESITITEPDPITLEVICSESSICQGDTVTISASAMGGTGNLTFEWGNGETGETIEVTSSGEYCVTVTDDNGCEHTACCEVEKCPEIEAEASGMPPTDSTNSDGQIKITVNEGANDTFDVVVIRVDLLTGDTISIDTLIGVVADSMGCILIDSLMPGLYELEVSDSSGDRDPWEGSSEVPPFEEEPVCDISVMILCPSDLICPGDSAELDLSAIVSGGSGNYTISWSTGETTEDITVDEDGTYCVTVVDNDIIDCEDVACCEIEIEECPEIVVDSIVCSVICPMDSTGTAAVYAHGGCAPLSFEWSNGESGSSIEGLTGGTYCVTITDAEGCEVTVCCDVVEEDNEDPVAKCVEQLEVFLNADCEASITVDDVDDGSTDNCGIDSMELDKSEFDCDDGLNSPVQVTLTVTDIAGNTDECVVLVDVFDVIPPEFDFCPPDMTVDTDPGVCFADVIIPEAMASDNCGMAEVDPPVFPITNDAPDVNPMNGGNNNSANASGFYELGETIVEFTATDKFGNVNNTQCSTKVTVQDNENPNVVCPPDQTIYMVAPFCQGIADYPPATATDNCDPPNPVTITYSIPLGEIIFPIFDNTVTVTATDGSGNTATCTFELILEDTIPPNILGCPSGTVFVPTDPDSCFATNPYTVVLSDNCPGVIGIFDPPLGFQFPLGNTPVNITAIDASENSSTCSFSVTVEDQQPPTFTLCPPDFTVSTNPGMCSGNAFFSFIAEDNCTPVTFNSNFDSGDLFPVGISTVVINASDDFDNVSTCSFNLTVVDDEDPVAVCQDVVLPLGASGFATLSPFAVDNGSADNCGIVSRSVFPNSFSCNNIGTDSVVLVVFDGAGNSDSCSAEVTIVDNIDPVANCKDLTVYVDSMGSYDLDPKDIDDNSTDNCGIETLNAVPNYFTCTDIGQVDVVLTVTDSSGNSATCISVVSVMDTLPPEILCPADEFISVPAGQTSAFVNLDNATATDNCAVASIVNDFNAGGADASDNYPLGTTSVVFTSTDDAGNTGSCTTLITVSDQPIFSISGQVATEDGTPVNEVFMNVTGTSDFTDTTDMDGEYGFSVLPGDSVTVTPFKDTNYNDGVTTLSLINIQRHILFIQVLNSPYKIIAADANNNGVIATSDLISLQRLILNIDPQFPNSSWRFLKADYQFTDPTNPLAEDWPEYWTYPNVMQDYPDEDWIGIKIGDVVGNASGIRQISGECDIMVQIEDRKDGTIELVLSPMGILSFTGYQFEFEFDHTKMELQEVVTDYSELPNLSWDRFNLIPEEGLLRAIWYHFEDVSYGEDLEIFRLRFRVDENVRPEDHFKLKYAGENWFSEVYSENGGKILEPSLVWKKEDVEEKFALYQNRPNPFSRETIIPFLLPHEMEVTLEFTDVEGRLLKTINIDGVGGPNEWRLSNDQLPEGVIFYRLITDQWTASGKMMKLR